MRQKTSDLRYLYASIILHVRSGTATSRTTLASTLGISASTVGIYVDQLLATGHLTETGLEHGSMGRPKRMLRTSAVPGWFAGVEFTANRVQLTGVDFAGMAMGAMEIPLPNKPAAPEIQHLIFDALKHMIHEQPLRLLGIGVGAPGLVNTGTGVCLRFDFIPGWENIPLRDSLYHRFGVPVRVENSLRAIALAERWFGSHQKEKDYLIVAARSGFGIASVQGGQLMHGANHAAGEIGLWPWETAGEGAAQELHHSLSAPMVYRRLAGLSETAPVPKDLYTALFSLAHERGERWDRVAEDFGRVLACVQLLLDPRLCLLHGPLTALGEPFCRAIMKAALRIAPALNDIPLILNCTQLGDEAGALGAASLAMEDWSPNHI
ncbi:ROK family protein [Prosthecobacter sp. SYSU 5D2]|uniref:ROK family protein n=1 Tax=Prosthecobacter sp. SYSU 5D2 TaxID=3134134 RepID=UPI0031FE796F